MKLRLRKEKPRDIFYLDNICPYGYWDQFKNIK